MMKVLVWVKSHKILSIMFLILVLGVIVYFCGEQELYCEDDDYNLIVFEDDSRVCIRETVKSLRSVGIYACKDSEHYSYDENNDECVIKQEYSTAPIKKKKCIYESGVLNTRSELVGVDEPCKDSIYEQGLYSKREFRFHDSREVYSCPDGYHLSGNTCIVDGVLSTTIESVCPSGYKLYRGYKRIASTVTYPFENPQCVKIEEKQPKSRWSGF